MSKSPNGQDVAPPVGPSLNVHAQYLRDLSFENPRAPDSLIAPNNATPEVKIDIDVKARQLNEGMFESVLTIKAEARQGEQVAFLVEASYGAVVSIQNATQDMIAALLLIETPRLIFPFARTIVADATRDGGFPPLLINPVDFAELHRRKALAAAEPASPANN